LGASKFSGGKGEGIAVGVTKRGGGGGNQKLKLLVLERRVSKPKAQWKGGEKKKRAQGGKGKTIELQKTN